MDVEIVSIGDELLLGFTIDTNAAHFARVAAERGIRVVRRATVGDGAEGIAAAVREALDRTGAVITSGGLGPTADDLTKPAIATLFGRKMFRDEAIIEALRKRWKARGWPGELPRSNEEQAMIPEGATILENHHGSAPGIWLEDAEGRWVAMLPGVPREFRGMTADSLLPRLESLRATLGDRADSVVLSRTLRTTGIAESALADLLGELAKDPRGASLAFLPGWEGVDLRLTVWDQPRVEAERRVSAAALALRERVGKHIYGEGEADLAALVLTELQARAMQVAVAESCTGGMLGMRLTAIPGSSASVMGGVIAYDNSVKLRDLGVRKSTLAERGAVSEETAQEMAVGARTRFAVDAAMAITGVAGPGGGTPEKPVGTFCVAVDVRGAVHSLRASSVGDRHEIRQRATQAALSLLLRTLRNDPQPLP